MVINSLSVKKTWTWAGWAAALAALAFPALAFAQAGTLDTTFSADGKAMVNFSAGVDFVDAVVVQPDGKIVTAGVTEGGTARFALARHNPDGTLDPSFGGDGRVTTNFTSGFDLAEGLALQGDGKLIVVGWAAGLGGRIALARHEVDGALDATFSGDGKVLTNLTSGNDYATAVALQADGKIVVTGAAGGVGGRVAVLRYDADGSLDSTFSGDGKLLTNFTSGRDYATSVELQGDGKIVVAGIADFTRPAARFALARYELDGSLDSTFSGDGKVMTNLTSRFDGAFGLAVQPSDEKIVAVGWADHMMGLVRYETDGTVDPTFAGGVVLTNFTAGTDYASGVELQADGRIVVAGPANYSARDSKFAVARYTVSGALDSTFSSDGKVTTNFTPGRDRAYALTLQPPDGKIVVAGEAAGQGRRFALARYLAN
jgi:uncharacterized delta-60 repeat protein